MNDNGFLLDVVTLSILAELSPSNSLRYVELRNRLNLSDSTLTNRLHKLRSRGLARLRANAGEMGRNYITYELTDRGRGVVEKLGIKDFLHKVDSLALTERRDMKRS